MWKKILTLIQTVITLAKDLERNREEIKEIRQDILNLTLSMQRLADEIRLTNQREASEREKLALQIENELLRFDQRLLPDKQDTSHKQPSKKKISKVK